jgi:heme-degrading monooxygenase HmoA
MYVRLTIVPQVKKDRIDEAIQFFDENIVPASRSQKGYRGAWLLLDRKKLKGLALTMWDSEEDAIANEKSGYYQEQLVKFMGFLASPSYIREGYEVVVQAE